MTATSLPRRSEPQAGKALIRTLPTAIIPNWSVNASVPPDALLSISSEIRETPQPAAQAPLKGEPKAIQHSVRFYEKGDSPLEYLTSRQWFVRLLDKKERLIEMGRRIHWRPGICTEAL